MKELVEKFSQPEELVVDLCSGTFSTALGCLLLSKYRKFIGCERDAECFSHARRHVFNRLAFEIQNGTPSFPITPELRDASREVLRCTGCVRKLEVWKAPRGFQSFPPHILLYCNNVFGTSQFLRYGKRPIKTWTQVHQGFFNNLDRNLLRDIDAMGLG